MLRQRWTTCSLSSRPTRHHPMRIKLRRPQFDQEPSLVCCEGFHLLLAAWLSPNMYPSPPRRKQMVPAGLHHSHIWGIQAKAG